MQTKGRHIHRGELLAAAVDARNVNVSKMVKRMGISRGTYYNHIADPDLPLEQLAAYGKAIGYDFSPDLPPLRTLALEEPEPVYKTPKTLVEALAQIAHWRERYYGLMEKYHRLVDREKGKE